MLRLRIVVLVATVTAGAAATARAQDVATPGACATPDSVAFRGNSRITDDLLRADVGISPRTTLSSRDVTRAIKNLYATGQFEENIANTCEIVNGKTLSVFTLKERRVLSDVNV